MGLCLSLTGLGYCSEFILKGVTPDSFRYMMMHQGVESIGFFNGGATTEQMEAIFQGLRHNTTLHELTVPDTQPPVDMSILSASLTVNNTLQDLTLACELDGLAMKQLSAGLRANKSVTRLNFQCHITDIGSQHFAKMLAANKTVQELNLLAICRGRIIAQRISDHTMEKLSAGLRANKSVTKLTLRHCITDTEAQRYLATMLAVNVTLQKLDLSSGSILDIGVSHLSRALQHNSSVTHLDLSYNESITNTGAVALGEMLRVNKSLRELDLHGTSVGEEGATALMEGLQHNQALNKLWIPRRLKEYCKKHTLYGSVHKSTKFEFY